MMLKPVGVRSRYVFISPFQCKTTAGICSTNYSLVKDRFLGSVPRRSELDGYVTGYTSQ